VSRETRDRGSGAAEVGYAEDEEEHLGLADILLSMIRYLVLLAH